MQLGGPTRTTKYYCPHCRKSQWLFSLKPVATDRWTCTKCDQPFRLDMKAIAHSWLNTITFWSLFPLALLLTVFFIVFVKADKMIWALLVGVPVFTIGLAILVYVCCIPIGLVVASRVQGKSGSKSKALKTVLREVS